MKTFDPACYELALHFLRDEPYSDDKALYGRYCDSLAKCIQDAIEDWFITPIAPEQPADDQ